MKERLLSLLLVLVCLAGAVPGASALHPRRVEMLEGEACVGISFPIGGYRGGQHNESASLGLEGRYNFRDTPWDLGLAFRLSCAERRFGLEQNDPESSQNNRTIALLAISHYNFNQGGKFNPYAGVGVGVGYLDVVGTRVYPLHSWTPAVAPCVGIEFVTHARVTLHFNLSRRGFNNMTLTFGAVLGGGPKQKPKAEAASQK